MSNVRLCRSGARGAQPSSGMAAWGVDPGTLAGFTGPNLPSDLIKVCTFVEVPGHCVVTPEV